MTLVDVVARISQIETMLSPSAAAPAPAAASAASSGFQAALQGATASSLGTAAPVASAASLQAMPALPGALAPASGAGARMVALAQQEVGVSEQPPGSNDAPRIAQYRTATAGSGVGPWCAYFVSWLANQSGAPLGEAGQGFGSVSAVAGWAQRTGRWLPAGSTPQPGDLIVWGGEHIGLVESVDPDGAIHTIEGNSSNAVSRRTYGSDGGGATGYVRM